MASPFSIFRKHQRAMMAALGILCMIGFTVGGVAGIGERMENSRDRLVVTTRFGDYRETDLQNMRAQRALVTKFLVGVLTQIRLLSFDEQVRPFLESRAAQEQEMQIERAFGPPTESVLVESRVLAAEAKRRGIVVNDEAIDAYLQQITGGQFTGRQFQEQLSKIASRGDRVTKSMLYDALRTELLAMRLQENFQASLVPTPAQRWDYYQRLRRRVRIELVPVKAEDFVAEIKDPPDDVALKFFEKYRDDEPQPGSPEPGFKLPHRAAFEYLEAHYDHFFHPETVSADEVQKFYEANKDSRFLYNDVAFRTSEVEDESGKDTPDEKTPDEKTPDEKKPDEKKPAAKTPDEKKPAGKSADKAPEKPKADDDKPAAKEEPGKEDAKDGKPADDSSDSSDDATKPDSSCAADPADADELADESKSDDADKPAADSKPAADAPADLKPKDEPAAEKSPAAPSAPALTPPAQSIPAGSTPPAEGTPAATDQPSETPAATGSEKPKTEAKPLPPQLTERYMLPDDIAQGAKPKYEPLWRVEEAIRKELAGAQAVEEMEKVLKGLQVKIGGYGRTLADWEARKKDHPEVPQPKPPSFDELAKGIAGVTVGEVPLGADYEVLRAPGIGESNIKGQPFVSFGFLSVRKYQANIAQDNDSNRYLFWKTDDQEARVPSFEEAEPQVVRAWKMREARKPMRKKAEALVEEARKSGKSLKETFAAQKLPVADPPSFSWLTTGTAGDFNPQSQPRLSEVPDTDDVGPEFMRSVYDLQPGDVGVAENHPETVAYVVRMTSSLPPEQVLRDTFLVDRFDTYAAVAQEANVELYRDWLREQLADAQVHWERPAFDEARLD